MQDDCLSRSDRHPFLQAWRSLPAKRRAVMAKSMPGQCPPTHNGRDESLCTCTAIARHVSHQDRQQRRAVYDYRDAGVPKHGVLMLVQQTHQAAKLGALITIGG